MSRQPWIRHHERMGEDADRTEELEVEQGDRESAERRMADEDPTEAGTATHDRRADKAAYLKEKLAERAKNERRDT
ncbi:MAG: hypothetical protein ABIZ50_01505 [Solirubrobacterales bacterium]